MIKEELQPTPDDYSAADYPTCRLSMCDHFVSSVCNCTFS